MNNILVQTICGVSLALVAFTVPTMSQEKKAGDSAHKIVHSGDLKWTPIIKGCEIALVEGNLEAEGQPFVARFHCSDGAKTPPHWHPTDEHVTVLSGTFALGMGEKFDKATMKDLPAGGFALLPAEMRHYAVAKTAAVVQVHGQGPFALTYVNPADDPSKRAPATN